MPTLNRFPLLGLWAREAARRIRYSTPDAEALGHAYAVLYAIRANRQPKTEEPAEPKRKRPRRPRGVQELQFAGDTLDVSYDGAGHVVGRVGGERPQTPRSYRTSVGRKFPPGYLDDLSEAFREVLKTYAPSELNSRLVYRIYDEWKKDCAVGRRVDLDCLLEWCRRAAGTGDVDAAATPASAPNKPRGRRTRASPSRRSPVAK